MKHTSGDLADKLGCRLLGDSSANVTNVSSLPSATSDSLVFVETPQHLDRALRSCAAAVIAGDFADVKSADSGAKPLLISAQPRLTFARAAKLLRGPQPKRGIHPSAIVPASATIGNNVAIGARTVLGEHATIGDETTIGSGSVIGDDVSTAVRIGNHCRLDANVTIYPGTTLGDRVIVQAGAVLGSEGFGYVRDTQTGHYEQFPQVGKLVIEDDVEIGANSTIDRGALDETRIRRGTKIDNLVHIGHNCDIGEDVILVALTGISGSCTLGKGAVIAGQVGIGDHAHIGPGVILGGQAGVLSGKTVTNDGLKPGTVLWGTPARPLMQVLREIAVLTRLAKKQGSGVRGQGSKE